MSLLQSTSGYGVSLKNWSAWAVVLFLASAGAIAFTLGTSAAMEEAVQNVTATPYNGGAEVAWTAATSSGEASVTSYEVSYGTSSVAEGLATQYDKVVNAGNKTSVSVSGLTNGVKYYVAVKAVFSDGQKSAAFSEESSFIPSSIYSPLPAGSETHSAAGEDTTAPVVESAMALTKTLVRIKFSEAVKLPEILPEVSFTVTKSQDVSQNIPVEKAEYRIDYAGESNEQVRKELIWLTLSTPLEVDTEYTVTVSASVTDEAENPLESGVTDYALFTGTDRTEIPAEEQALKGAVPENSTDPSSETPPESSPPSQTPPVPPADTTPPENITDFRIEHQPLEKEFSLNLFWKKSASPDAADQRLYQDVNNQGFGPWISLGKDAEKYSTAGAPESEIKYKITVLDNAGNENSGTIASIRLPALPSSGAPIGLLALGFSLAFSGIRRWNKKN